MSYMNFYVNYFLWAAEPPGPSCVATSAASY
jgi:hypothetical protein